MRNQNLGVGGSDEPESSSPSQNFLAAPLPKRRAVERAPPVPSAILLTFDGNTMDDFFFVGHIFRTPSMIICADLLGCSSRN